MEMKTKFRSTRSYEGFEDTDETQSPKTRRRIANMQRSKQRASNADEINLHNLTDSFSAEKTLDTSININENNRIDPTSSTEHDLVVDKLLDNQLNEVYKHDISSSQENVTHYKVEEDYIADPNHYNSNESKPGLSKANAIVKNVIKEELCEDEHTGDDDRESISDRRKKRKTKSKYNNMDNNDLEKMLKWKNGVGYLPGSNLKFRKSDIGALDLITPSDDEAEQEGNEEENSLEKKFRKRRAVKRQEGGESTPLGATKIKKLDTEHEKKKRKDRKKKFAEDELLKCETCGCYGLISEFRSSGRFCSQRCVGAYASKRRAEMIAKQFASGERPLPKTVKRPLKKRKRKHKDTPNRSPLTDKDNSTVLNEEEKISDDSSLYYNAVGRDVEFDWDTYLKVTETQPANHAAFVKEYPELDLFPTHATYFKPTMKLECVDIKHQSHICVVSVVEVQGARMRLHFDGWSESYDFWINCDSPFLHPCGWCKQNGQKLNPPKGIHIDDFSWPDYLDKTGCKAAPAHLFHSPSPTLHGFTTNMKLEAVDRKNPDLICVSSVNNVIGNHFLIHFDEWDDQYDYWCKDDSPFIHPVGWCMENQVPLVPPTDEMVNKFVWEDYLKETNTIAAPKHIFKLREEEFFEAMSKLEVVDPRNPSLVRVATITEVEEYRVKIHFDGWSELYDYWFDYDSTDLHPVNWCMKTGHTLEPPPVGKDFEDARSCGTPGCRGIGHIKGLKYTTHHTSFGCPYTNQNLHRSTAPVVDRLAPNAMTEETSICNRIHNKKFRSPEPDVFPDSTTKEESKKTPFGRATGKPLKKRHRLSDTPLNNHDKTGVKKRKRRRSDEVSSSTSPSAHHIYDSKQAHKPIPSTHIPAGHSLYLQGKALVSKAIPWSQDDVVEFLKRIGHEDLVPCFVDNQIDGQALLLLSQADLVHHLKLKLGPALKIYSEISKL